MIVGGGGGLAWFEGFTGLAGLVWEVDFVDVRVGHFGFLVGMAAAKDQVKIFELTTMDAAKMVRVVGNVSQNSRAYIGAPADRSR